MTEVYYESCFATLISYNTAATSSKLPLLFHKRNSITIPLVDERLEIELLNSIKIYGDGEVFQKLMQLVNKYPTIWKSLGFVQISLKHLIKINLKSG